MKFRSMGIVAVALMFALALSGCSGSPQSGSSEGPDYADDEAMAIIAKGLEARWAITDVSSYESNAENLKKAVNAELDVDKALRDRQFEDPKMQEDVLKYINKLEDSLSVLEQYPYGSSDYHDKWSAVYSERTVLLKVFVDSYGLTVSQSKQNTLDELLTAGTAAQNKNERDDAIKQLFENVEFEKVDNGHGYYKYSAIVTNSTDYSFKDVSIVLALYDSDNVMADESHASVNTWEKGDTVKFEGSSDVDAVRVKATVDRYSTID